MLNQFLKRKLQDKHNKADKQTGHSIFLRAKEPYVQDKVYRYCYNPCTKLHKVCKAYFSFILLYTHTYMSKYICIYIYIYIYIYNIYIYVYI